MVAKTIVDNDGLVDLYSFWTFSDLFEEGGQFSAPFHGGYGLQNIYGIPKPTYRLFEMFHNTGELRIPVEGGNGSTVEMLAVRDHSKLSLLAYNHNVPGGEISDEACFHCAKEYLARVHRLQLPGLIRITPTRKRNGLSWACPEYPTAFRTGRNGTSLPGIDP